MSIVKIRHLIWKERDAYIIKDLSTGVTTQGKTREDAIQNLREAVALYLEEKNPVNS
jgi:predicted RNase H-like HicB family nuclease